MFSKKIRSGKTLQSGRKVGLATGGLRNPKRSQDLRSALAQKKMTKTQPGRTQITGKSRPGGGQGDARQKIVSKRTEIKPVARSISLLEERRKEQRQNLHQKNRSLTLATGGSIQVTTRQEAPPERMATMMGDSIRITAKVERNKEDMDRQANVFGGFLTITAKNDDAKRKERENQVRKRERQNAARKREQEREARRKEKEREHTVYSQVAEEENHIYTSTLSRENTSGRFRDSVLEGRLDHSGVKTSQSGKAAAPAKDEGSSKITVSNLHPAVTQQDVEKLFGVIGNLKSCKMLGRGCAEVVYVHKEHALLALSRYHNRKLDGQPMQCKLNTLPSASLYSPPPTRPAPLAPLAPLRPAATSSPRPLLGSVPAERNHRTPNLTAPATKPVVFKVRI